MQFHDPQQLINEVAGLLRSHGLAPQTADHQLAYTGACMLLRGLGVTPAVDPVDAYTASYTAGPWPDVDDRSASAHQLGEQYESRGGNA